MTWLTSADLKAPQQQNYQTLGDFILAYTVIGDVENAGSKFLTATLDPQYASPQAYITSKVQQAIDLPKFNAIFATPNPIASGVKAAMDGIELLSKLPVNAGDPNTVSILTAWENGTGQLYGGHAPIPAPPAGDGTNPATAGGNPGTIFA